jgi:hypothetical protein
MAAERSDTFGWRFYDEQIALINAADADALVERHYATDGALLRLDGPVRGHKVLKPFFRECIKAIGSIQVLVTDQFVETADSIFFEATAQTEGFGRVRVYDAFVLRDGKATHHFTGVK